MKAKTLLDDINITIQQYKQDISDEKNIDLNYFEEAIKELCTTVASLPQEEAQDYKEDLENLGNTLQDFSQELQERQNLLKTKITDLNTTAKAQAAYGKGLLKDTENQ